MTTALATRPATEPGAATDRPRRRSERRRSDPRRSGRRASLPHRWSAPAIAAVLAAAVAALGWVRWGWHLAAGDIGHFVRDRAAAEFGSFFGYALTGAGSATYEIARAVELPFWWVGSALGDAAIGQGLYYVALAAGTAAAGAFWVAPFARRRAIAVGLGLVAVVNPLTLITFPNPNTLLATATAALVGGLLLRPRRRADGALLAAATLPAAYLAVNPPTMVVLVATVAVQAVVAAVARPGPAREPLLRLARALPWVLLVHLWWVVPQALVLFGGDDPVAGGITSVDAWAWAHRNNSPGRILTLGAHWGWDETGYFPYASLLDRWWWGWTAYVLPVLALAAPVVGRGRRRPATVLALAAIAGLVAATGLHAPADGLNRWLYDTVPGWWLFREPVTKWGILVLVVYLAAAAITLGGAAEVAARSATWRRRALAGVVAAAAAVPVLAPWPLLTGAVADVDRSPLPPARSRVPAEWHEVAAALDERDRGGKILVLPVPAFYQSSTTWGYHGVDAVPLQLLTRPVVAPTDGAYFADPTGAYPALATTAQDALLRGDDTRAVRALRALGVTDVLLRRDLEATAARPLTADPAALQAALDRSPWAEPHHGGEVAVSYRVAHPAAGTVSGRVATYGTVLDASARDLADPTALVAPQPTDTAVVTDLRLDGSRPSVVLDAQRLEPGAPAVTVDAGTQLRPVMGGPLLFDVAWTPHHVEITPRLWPSSTTPPSTRVELDGAPVRLRIGGATLPLDAEAGRLTFAAPPAASVVVEVDATPFRLDPAAGELGDCNNLDGRPLAHVDIAATPVDGGVALSAGEHSACLQLDLPPLAPGDTVRLTYTRERGSPARACLFDPSTDTCVADARATGDTGRFRLETTSALTGGRLYLYADGEEGASRIRYADLAIGREDHVAAPLPGIDDIAVATNGDIEVAGTVPEPRLAGPGPLGDCYRVDDRAPHEVGLAARPLGDGVELTAAAHAACVVFDADRVVPGGVYDLAVDVERVAGRPPRLCVWAPGGQGCVAEATAETPAGGTGRLRVRFEAPLDAETLEVYVYADGPQRGRTVARYARPELTLDPAVSWVTAGADHGAGPAVVATAAAPGRVQAQVAAADRPFLLTLADGDADRWQLTGVDPARVLGRATVDGFAPGWLVAPGPDVAVTFRHGPDAAVARFHLAWAATLAAILLTGLGLAVRRARRGDEHRR